MKGFFPNPIGSGDLVWGIETYSGSTGTGVGIGVALLGPGVELSGTGVTVPLGAGDLVGDRLARVASLPLRFLPLGASYSTSGLDASAGYSVPFFLASSRYLSAALLAAR